LIAMITKLRTVKTPIRPDGLILNGNFEHSKLLTEAAVDGNFGGTWRLSIYL